MKNKKTKGLVAVLMLIVMMFSLTLTGCGEPTNLEEYVKADEELAKELESYCVPNMSVEIVENTMTFTYKYEETFIDDTVKLLSKELKKTLKDVSPTYIAVRDKLEEDTGFEDIVLVITYTDAEGTVLRSQEY